MPPDVLARYVGAYTGISGERYSERTYEVLLSDDQLIARILGDDVEGGLAATGLDADARRPLVPVSQTLFEGLGLGYEFIVDDQGVATDLVVIHISGRYTFSRDR